MAIRLLPFRQYNEHDVINLFALDDSQVTTIPSSVDNNGISAPEQNGKHDNGVLVRVKTCDLRKEPIEYGAETYLGKTDYPHIGRNQYPKVPHTFVAAQAADKDVFGVTLRQTLTHDENGEKLLYYPQKALELNAVFPGQAVPILTRGLITVSAAGLGAGISSSTTVGSDLYSDANGKFTTTDGNGSIVGKFLGFGDRAGVGTNPDYFAGDGSTGGYALVKLGL